MTRATIQEYLQLPKGIEVRENIKHEIVLMPNADDIRRGKISDPKGCALKNAACRVFGYPICAVGPRFAFIPQRDERGRVYIARMEAAGATRDAIAKFDKTGKMPIAGFRFKPVSKSNTYAGKRRVNRLYMKKVSKEGYQPTPRKTPRQTHVITRFIPHNWAA